MNWMIAQLNRVAGSQKNALLPPGARVREDVFGTSHNPSIGLFDLTYHEINRNMYRYVTTPPVERSKPSPVDVFKDTLCIHDSVLARRDRVPLQAYENRQLDFRAIPKTGGKACLKELKARGKACLEDERIDGPRDRWKWPVHCPAIPIESCVKKPILQIKVCSNFDDINR